MLDKLANDHGILGWTFVVLPPFDTRYHAVDIVDWCTDNCTGEFKIFGIRFVLEKSCDAEWFILRWQ